MTDDLVETAHQDYIEVTSKQTGGKVRYFLCPHCRASFDAIGNALTRSMNALPISGRAAQVINLP